MSKSIISILVLLLFIMIALILLSFQEKYKWLKISLAVIGMVTMLIGVCNYFFNYDPAIELKKILF